jgi:hypothetical protein
LLNDKEELYTRLSVDQKNPENECLNKLIYFFYLFGSVKKMSGFNHLPEEIVLHEICPFLDLQSRLSLMESTGAKVHQPICKSRLIKTLGLLKNKVFPKFPIHHSELLPTYEKCICILKDIRRLSTRDRLVEFGKAFLHSLTVNINFVKNDKSEENKVFLPSTESKVRELLIELLRMLDKIKLILYRWNIRNEISEY